MTAVLNRSDVRPIGRATGPLQQHRCDRGARCFGHELLELDGQRVKAGAVCDRPLCDVCERAVGQALEDAPGLYRDLRNASLVAVAAVRSEMVSASRGTPLPLNARPLHLAEQLHWLLTTWEDEVRSIAGLSYPERAGKREGRQVQEAAVLLGSHLSAWIAAPVTVFATSRWTDDVEQSGAAAAAALLDWRSEVRMLPGLDMKAAKAIRRYEHRCPACGVRAVTHRAGDDLMQCQSCLATAPYLPTLPREADYRVTVAA